MKGLEQTQSLPTRVAGFLGASGGGLRARVLRSGIWVGFSSIAQNILQTVRSIILARLLTPEIFGLMALCTIVVRGLDLFTETGIGPALIHRQEEVEKAKDTAFTLQVARGFILALLACAVAPLAAAYYGEAQLNTIILWLAVGFAIGGFVNIDIVLLQKKLDFRRLTVLDVTLAFSSSILLVGLAYWLRSVWALVYGQLSTALLRLALSYLLIPSRPSLRFDRRIAGELFRYGRFITGLTIVLFITMEVDNLFVGKILGFEQLGFYTLAYALANIPATHISKVVSSVVFPAYSTLQGNQAAMRAAYLAVLRLAGGIAIPAAAGLALLAPEIVRIVYGEQWLPMVTALRILALFGAARAIGILGGSLFNAIGRPNLSFYLVSIKLLAILAIIYPMTVRFGIEGAAAAVALPQIVGDTVALYIVTKQIELKVSVVARILGRVSFAAIGMCLVVHVVRYGLSPIGPVDLGALVAVGAVAYVLLSLRELRALYLQQSGRVRDTSAVSAVS